MGRMLEVIGGQVTAPSTTFTAWTLGAGMSLQVKASPVNAAIKLMQVWCDNQTAGNLRIKSPRMHDNVQGLRFHTGASDVAPLLPWGIGQKLYSQDVLTAEQTGSATAGDVEGGALLVGYDDVQGVNGRFIKYEDVLKHGVHALTNENTLALGTAGGLSGEEAINAEIDLLKANTDYAVLGATFSAECLLVGLRGPDTGNVRVGLPGNETLRHVTADWFARLSRAFNEPWIPVINSANKASTFLDGMQDENGTDVLVTLQLVELAPTASSVITK